MIRKLLLAIAALMLVVAPAAAQTDPSLKTREMIQTMQLEKASRTPAQRKIDSHLLYAARRGRGQDVAPGIKDIPAMTARLKRDAGGRVEVDVRGAISDALLDRVRAMGGRIVNAHPQFKAARILIRLEHVEDLAALPEVKSLMRAEQPISNRVIPPATSGPSRTPQTGDAAPDGRAPHASLRDRVRLAVAEARFANPAAPTSAPRVPRRNTVRTEGDVAHEADQLRAAGIDGTGLNIGVLSDGVDSLADLVASGELPPVTVVNDQVGTGTEGTAMLEVIHDMAPGANLFFATGSGGQVQMMANILALHAAGCRIIVDDLYYPTEPAFQDGLVAIAVNAVTAGGTLYIGSAGNSGNFNDGTSGVWEGDFHPGGIYGDSAANAFDPYGFDIFNTIVTASTNDTALVLQWSDPFYAAGSDYDLYVVDSGGSVLCASNYVQNGDEEAREFCDAPPAGSRAIVVLYDGEVRALHLNSNRGVLQYGTPGQTYGHHAAFNTISVGAVPVSAAMGGVFTGGPATQVETFSSDGLRRVFYSEGGIPITPSSVRFDTGGGRDLFKVNIAAADCVSTTSPGFGRFCGTSAAAPHAAAIAALLWSAKPTATRAQVRDAMLFRALDIEEHGWDRDSGYGIVMAKSALRLLTSFDLGISMSHATNFFQGQAGATYAIVVRNNGPDASVGAVTVTDALPLGLALTGLQGDGWSCSTAGSTCTRSDALAAGSSYPTITVTVDVSSGAPASVTNSATLQSPLDHNSGNNIATDETVVRQRTATFAHAANGQYSDATALRATITPAEAGNVRFFVDGGSVGSVQVVGGEATLNYLIQVDAGSHAIRADFVPTNPLYLPSSNTASLTVLPEDAAVTALASSPTAVKVTAPGGAAGPFVLQAEVVDAADGSPGNLSAFTPVSFTLVPELGGASIECAATMAVVAPGTLRATCAFPSVPVNLYVVRTVVSGSYYAGSASSILAIFDPSLGFVTGGGIISRGGYVAEFGVHVRFNKGGQARGALLYIEHRPTGDVVLKSNALDPLVIVRNTAAIKGKATLNDRGHHQFTATVIDNGEPGRTDRFGLEVVVPSGQVEQTLSYTPVTIAGGNIQVPQQAQK